MQRKGARRSGVSLRSFILRENSEGEKGMHEGIALGFFFFL